MINKIFSLKKITRLILKEDLEKYLLKYDEKILIKTEKNHFQN